MPTVFTNPEPPKPISETKVRKLIASVQFLTSDQLDKLSSATSPEATKMVICTITLKNGEAFVAEVQCPQSIYDVKLGQKLAEAKAMRKIWGHRERVVRDHTPENV